MAWCLCFEARPDVERLGPLGASEGLDSGPAQVNQPLQIVAGRHQRHRKVRPRLTDGTDQLATHLLHRREHVLDPRTGLGDPVVAPALAFGQRVAACALALDVIAVTGLLELRFPSPAW